MTLRRRDKPVYGYEVVTANAHGIHGREFKRCADAKDHAAYCAERSPALGPFEIQRVEHGSAYGRRYWMRKRSRWVLWSSAEDEQVRQPDWIWHGGKS